MDYSVILSQVVSNQLEIVNILNSCKNALEGIFLLFSIYFIYIFIRNLLKG